MPLAPFAVVGALALALALPAAAMADDGAPDARTIRVTGEGEVKIEPDIARITIGVTTNAESAADALAANSRAMSGVIAAVKAAGVADEDVATSRIDLSPVWSRAERAQSRREITGHVARNTVTATLRDLTKAGELLDAASRAGATDLGTLVFDIADRAGPLAEARRLAVADARARAELYAEAAGVGLGDLLRLSEPGSRGPAPVTRGAQFATAAMSESVPIEAGSLTVRAAVRAVYAID